MEDIRKPSEFIKPRQSNHCRIYASQKETKTCIIELVKNVEEIQQCQIPFDQPIFRPEPSNIVVEGFTPFKTYELIINFRNMDKVPRKIKLEPSSSPFFKIMGWKSYNLYSEKIAPGMEFPFVVQFKPEENTDYIHNLVCETEREKFIVPIRAVGARGLLDIADEIAFSEVPVNLLSTKTVLVRNIGDDVAKFHAFCEEPFSCSPESGCVLAGETIQLDIKFHPQRIGTFSSKMKIKYQSGDQMLVELLGSAENINVRLEKNQLRFENSITLTNQKMLKIFNRTDYMVHYKWKMYASTSEDQHEKAKKLLLSRESERHELQVLSSQGQFNDLSLVKQKYENLSKEIKEAFFSFTSEEFRIEPSEGVIWPHSAVEANVSFTPTMVGNYTVYGYCEVEGRESRLPLQLRGNAFGPKVKFAYTTFKVNDIFINTTQKYEILLENYGDIPTNYSLRFADTLFGPQFTFSPASGRIKVGEQILIEVLFMPTSLGNFKEVFLWGLEGGADPVFVSYEGCVIGPTFHFNCDELMLPNASLGFSVEKEIILTNTSPIPMQFQLRVLNERGENEEDIELEPSEGVVDGCSERTINATFSPLNIAEYNGVIMVNVVSVGDDLLRLPYQTKSLVPCITTLEPLVKLGECFLNYPYSREITLVNDSDYPASFFIEDKENTKNLIYDFQCESTSGVVEPHSRQTVPVCIKIKRLGNVTFPILIRIKGSERDPLVLDVTAIGIGPEVKLSQNDIDWGKVPVLEESTKMVTVMNNSPIPANFICTILGDPKVFRVEPLQGSVPPGEECQINITAFLDDTAKFTEVINLSVVSGDTFEIPLVARGIGSTIVYENELKEIDFKDVFSNRECSRSFTLYNKGRRTHHLQWSHLPTKDPNILSTQIFEVVPNRFTLRPGSHQVIFIKGYCNKATTINDRLICHTTTDRDPTRKLLLESIIKVNFINPVLQINPTQMLFKSFHTTDDSFKILRESLLIRNTSGLSLNMSLKCPEPFIMDKEQQNLFLPAGEEVRVQISFDPTHNLSRISTQQQGKLTITYKEHPQKDIVELSSEIYFPNLTFEDNVITFECIENNTEQMKTFEMSNTSVLPVSYKWYFLSSSEVELEYEDCAFDVVPMKGYIEPGKTEKVKVFFYGDPFECQEQKAMCDVAGGPKYEITLRGQASEYVYRIEKQSIDYGCIPYQTILDQEVTVFNEGLVAFDFEVLIDPKSKLQECLMVTPRSGAIKAGEKQKLTIRFAPCTPDDFDEEFYIKVAHFEPQSISIRAKSWFPRVMVELPMEKDSIFNQVYTTVTESAVPDKEYEIDKQILKQKTLSYLRNDSMMQSDDETKSYVGSARLFSKSNSKEKEKALMTMSETSSVIHYNYVSDFGTAVKNTTTTKKFLVKNRGTHPVSFTLSKRQSSPLFSVEPERVKNLPPGESVEIVVSFLSKTDEETQSVEFNLMIQNGPSHLICFKVGISIPTISLNDGMNSMDFENVTVRFRKSMTISILNPNPVPCEWFSPYHENFKKQKKSISLNLKDFEIVPSYGYLEPFEKSTLSIRFTPSEQKDYDFEMPFKVNANPDIKYLQIKGKSIKPQVTFEPSQLNFGPILPYTEGVEMKVTIQNATSMPIELYSVEFDQQYRADEEILRQVEGYENDVMYLPPYDIQAPFAEYVNYFKRKIATEKKEDGLLDTGVGDLLTRTFSNSVTASESNASEVANCIIIHGPPLSGKTTLAKKVCEEFSKKYVTIDWIMEQAIPVNESSGSLSRAETSEEKPNFSEEQIVGLMKTWIQKEDWSSSKGYVFDGLETKYCNNTPFIVKALSKMLLEKTKKVIVFHLTLEKNRIRERENLIQEAKYQKELNALKVKELHEEDYDMLSYSEKEAYDLAMFKYKSKLKEITEKRRKEKRTPAEDIKLADRKNGDEKLKGRKRAHSRVGTQERHEKSSSAVPGSRSEKPRKVGSPKLPKKNAERNADKHGDRSPERETEDLLLHEEAFIHDVTSQRMENYSSTIEAVLTILREKEHEKMVPKTTTTTTISQEKKTKPNKINQEQVSVVQENEIHAEESAMPELHEINTNGLSEAAIFRLVHNHIPFNEEDQTLNGLKHLNEIRLEKILRRPKERPKTIPNKPFTIHSIQGNIEVDSESMEIAQPVSTTISITPAKQVAESKNESKRGGKGITKPAEERVMDNEEDIEKEIPCHYRWMLAPFEKKEVIVRYSPTDAITTTTSLDFEIAGYPYQFSLPCNGTSDYSTLNFDFKKMFAKWRKSKDDKPISGEFILSNATYDFGPLLFNKPRDKYLDRFPENKGTFNLLNSGPQELKVNLALKNDVKGDTFFFDPQALTIPPGKSQQVSLWAYPKVVGIIQDTMLISVMDNPEPYFFRISCLGVKPEIEVDRKTLAFDRLLLGRTERRELKLRNPTFMPVAWKISGTEALGEEITISATEGQLDSFGETTITGDFRAMKSLLIKKVIKLEATDVEKICGTAQEIPILVTAEAYDISIDIHFPKGFEGGLDFGVLKVGEDGKQLVTLKNKGKYEVGFRFLFDSTIFMDLLSITPMQGILQPSEKPFFVQIIFKSTTETALKDYPVLKCIVFEPSTGEVTASIPVKVSARSVFSKYTIQPVRDLNFGALVHGTKSSKTFVIENTGEFDFKYSIFKIQPKVEKTGVKSAKANMIPNAAVTPSQTKPRAPSPPAVVKPSTKKDAVKQADSLSFGPFTVFPISGVVLAGTKFTVNVDFYADSAGGYDETIGIEISDRSPTDSPDGLEYLLLGESCIPGINTTDFASIFEEQSICRRLELFKLQTAVYGEEDRVFHYGAYLVGQQVQAQFKISNPFKVQCDVALSTRPRGKSKTDNSDFAFEVEPKRITVPSHENRYVTVSFHPTSIQTYSGIFEALVENVTDGRNKCLTFELRGEGTLPRVVVEKPTTKGKNGCALLKFKKLLIGKYQTLPIVLKNDGIVTAKYKLEWYLKDNDDFFCKNMNSYQQLRPSETISVDITCQPSCVRKLEGELRLKVMDNTFEDTSIQILGEGYTDDLTFEDLGDDMENEIKFDDCYVGETKSHTFKLANHSGDWIKAIFGEVPDFSFVPTSIHIPPKSERDVVANFNPKNPCDVQHLTVPVKVSKFKYTSGTPDLAWDDRMKIIRWNNDTSKGGPKKVIESVPEPPIDIISQLNDYHIALNGISDFSYFEGDFGNIRFKSTLMFQSRVYRVPLKNTGKVSLRFSFDIFDDDQFTIPTNDPSFSISPSHGKVLPGDVVMIAVRFSPLEENDYQKFVFGKISNLPKDQKHIQFSVEGSSLRPYCHFELDDVDPLSLETRSPERSLQNGVPFALDPQTKIIEFKSCGIKVKTTNRFYIVNPTLNSYEYQWKMESVDQKVFKCMTSKGIVAPNKKSEMVFEFLSETLETKESLWTFSIPEHNVRIPFLLIGYAVEPTVQLSQNGINFRSVLVGRQAKETIVLTNEEKQPFSFQFSDTSVEMDTEGTPVLKISPMAGTIPPNSELPIDIAFLPPTEKLYNFRLICNVRKKPSPLVINVKGEGYIIRDSMVLELMDGNTCTLVGNTDNVVDFGVVQINEKLTKRVSIINSGKFNFDYSWKFLRKSNHFTISPEIGTVPKGERVFCDIVFSPTTATSHKEIKAVCQIQNGKSYTLSIQGTGSRPLVRFSPSSIDFGIHFIYKPTLPAVVKELEITNNDTTEMVLDVSCNDCAWYEVTKGIHNVSPKSTVKLPVTFHPKEPGMYRDTIKVEVNGLSFMEVPISGEGTELRIETDTTHVNFGAAKVGTVMTKSVKVTNKSKIGVQFCLGPSSLVQYLSSIGVSLSPTSELSLKPKSSASIDLKFSPHQRLAPFSGEIFFEHEGQSSPLFIVSGACQGIDIRLETDTLPFGAVVQRSFTYRKIQLQNVGDIGAKFSWDISKLTKDFTISPTEGYISPGMELPIEISFHPKELNMDIRVENIPCRVEGIGKLYLTLSGMCIPQPTHVDVLKYATPVRTIETKSIQITNRSSSHWHISPIIDNEYWSGAQFFDVEPGQTRSYDLNFYPLETAGNGEGGKHEGTVFFPLPDGSGILYKLNGTVDKVLPAASFTREVPCKTSFTEVVTVTNWLRKAQRLKVITDFGKLEQNVLFKGHEFLDLAPLQSKEYKFTYFAYKEGSIALKLIFKNETTQEYVFYSFSYKNLSPGIISTIDISSPVRQNQSREILITNPLTVAASFSGTSTHPDVAVPHSFIIPPRSESNINIEFLPLLPKESSGRIVFNSPELGLYQYDLKLNALPASQEKTLYFKVCLGTQQLQAFRFFSFAKQKTDYTCKIENAEFTVEKTISAPPVEMSVEVIYEPSRLGDTRGQLIISSPTGGDYICPLVGHSLAPKPQGPIVIKPGANAAVSFKNVFSTNAVFNCYVDNSSFVVKPTETIPAKKTIAISIGYKQPPEKLEKNQVKPTSAKTGKLTITNPNTNISWVYYLKYSNS